MKAEMEISSFVAHGHAIIIMNMMGSLDID